LAILSKKIFEKYMATLSSDSAHTPTVSASESGDADAVVLLKVQDILDHHNCMVEKLSIHDEEAVDGDRA